MGYALLSTSSGDVNGAKQVIKQKTSQEAKVDQVPDVKILTTLVKYLWSKDNLEFRLRVLAAVGFLVGAKVCFRLTFPLSGSVLLLWFLRCGFSFLFFYRNIGWFSSQATLLQNNKVHPRHVS